MTETLLDWQRALLAQLGPTSTHHLWPATVERCARWAGVDPLDLTVPQMQGWLGRYRSPATRATYARALRMWCRWAAAEGLREDVSDRLPTVRLPPGAPRPLSREQVEAVLARPMRLRSRAQVLLAVSAGLRVAEIARVRGEDLAAGTLVVAGKGLREDVLPVAPPLQRIAWRMPGEGWWFPSPTGEGPVGPRAVSATIGRALMRAGIDGTAHQLRHTYATELVRAGVPLTQVRALMRHQSLATTQRYVLVDMAALQRDVALLPWAA